MVWWGGYKQRPICHLVIIWARWSSFFESKRKMRMACLWRVMVSGMFWGLLKNLGSNSPEALEGIWNSRLCIIDRVASWHPLLSQNRSLALWFTEEVWELKSDGRHCGCCWGNICAESDKDATELIWKLIRQCWQRKKRLLPNYLSDLPKPNCLGWAAKKNTPPHDTSCSTKSLLVRIRKWHRIALGTAKHSPQLHVSFLFYQKGHNSAARTVPLPVPSTTPSPAASTAWKPQENHKSFESFPWKKDDLAISQDAFAGKII